MSKELIIYFTGVLLLGLTLVGCNAAAETSTQESHTATSIVSMSTLELHIATSTTSPSESLSKVKEASAIRIQDDWTGLSPLAPIEARYIIKRGDTQFTGNASFSVGGYAQNARTANVDLTIPADRVQSFLNTLAESPMEDGSYTPLIEHTDDYPSITIELQVGSETVTFFSQSQGVNNIPWGLTLNGKTYVVNSTHPAGALATLNPYLKKEEELNKLQQESQSGTPAEEPTPELHIATPTGRAGNDTSEPFSLNAPIYPGASDVKLTFSNANLQTAKLYEFQTHDKPDAILTWYKNVMVDKGWDECPAPTESASYFSCFRANEFTLYLNADLHPTDNITRVTVKLFTQMSF